jgi:TfoX/Sxy family transcriptional regulator of competence genes
MASRKETVDFIMEQIGSAGAVYAKRMFGEYGIYCDEKIVALVCDDELFVKPTEAGKIFLKTSVEGHPYPGSKPWLLISGEIWDDSEWLSRLVRITAEALPLARVKARKKPVKASK